MVLRNFNLAYMAFINCHLLKGPITPIVLVKQFDWLEYYCWLAKKKNGKLLGI